MQERAESPAVAKCLSGWERKGPGTPVGNQPKQKQEWQTENENTGAVSRKLGEFSATSVLGKDESLMSTRESHWDE